jgi:hypothetical protein
MFRLFAILGVLLGLAGCGESRPTRVVPVTPSTAASGDTSASDSRAVTKPARAIATH